MVLTLVSAGWMQVMWYARGQEVHSSRLPPSWPPHTRQCRSPVALLMHS